MSLFLNLESNCGSLVWSLFPFVCYKLCRECKEEKILRQVKMLLKYERVRARDGNERFSLVCLARYQPSSFTNFMKKKARHHTSDRMQAAYRGEISPLLLFSFSKRQDLFSFHLLKDNVTELKNVRAKRKNAGLSDSPNLFSRIKELWKCIHTKR